MTKEGLAKLHKRLKRETVEAEKQRNDDRSWKSKQELLDLKKQKLATKDKIQQIKKLDNDTV